MTALPHRLSLLPRYDATKNREKEICRIEPSNLFFYTGYFYFKDSSTKENVKSEEDYKICTFYSIVCHVFCFYFFNKEKNSRLENPLYLNCC